MRKPGLSIELATIGFALAYLPYVIITRMLTTGANGLIGRPLTGLEVLPAMMIFGGVFTYGFMYLAGWMRDVPRLRLGALAIPVATRWTALSGVCTALLLVTVPLSYTFTNVSIPFMQLLMRGDILVIAPLVDWISGRRVRWWSWAALALVALAMATTFTARGGLNLPPLALATIALYTLGYFGRLLVMSRISKDGDPQRLRRFFSEEKIVAFPIALVALLVVVLVGGPQGTELRWGFADVWGSPAAWLIAACGLMVCATGVLSAIILLDPRENSFCVPLERSASILAGVFGSILLAVFFGGRMPSDAEFAGSVLLISALVLLSVAPRLRRPAAEPLGETAPAA